MKHILENNLILSKMKKYILLATIILAVGNTAVQAQGCVAIRSTGGAFCSMQQKAAIDSSKWTLTINNRYFKSFRHFVGKEEQKQRVEEGSQVINHSFTTDLLLSYKLKNNWSVSANIPVISNTRSSLYEHDRKNRHSTSSFGIGDIRISAGKWLLDEHKKGNVQVVLGLKLPTGDYRYEDYFYKNDSTNVLGPVDQSIQLGDGGTGVTLELNSYYHFTKNLSVYSNFYYLLSPREQNGVSTARGGATSASSIRYTSDVMSVPDQYMIRAGLNYKVKSFLFSAGVRDECLPAKDLVGGSSGFRRPGYIISVEPGITYTFKKVSIYYFMPFAIKRDRTQSVPDKIRTELTGVYAQGDAAFADYLVNLGLTYNF
jgi:hypothetical protein